MKFSALCFCFLTTVALCFPLHAEEIFHEDFNVGYDRGRLVGQNGWTDWEKNPSSPVVYDTEGRIHPDLLWAVTCSKRTSSDDWAQKIIFTPQLTPDDKLVVEITATRELHPQDAGNGVTFGFGGTLMDKAIGLGHQGVFFRDGWGGTVYAVGFDGEYWNDFGSKEVLVIRSVWDLAAGAASLAVKNLSQAETEFTPLYFDKEQTRSTVELGHLSPLDSWNQVFIRTTGTKGALLFDVRIKRE
jgi:hypothetical protein